MTRTTWVVILTVIMGLHVNASAQIESYAVHTAANDAALVILETASELQPDETDPTLIADILRLNPRLDSLWAEELAALIEKEFEARDLDPVLGVALCFAESSFNPDALGPVLLWRDGRPVRCLGLFQLHPMHGIPNVMEPAINVAAGAEKLRQYIETTGSLRRGLRRYGTNVDGVMHLYGELQDGESD